MKKEIRYLQDVLDRKDIYEKIISLKFSDVCGNRHIAVEFDSKYESGENRYLEIIKLGHSFERFDYKVEHITCSGTYGQEDMKLLIQVMMDEYMFYLLSVDWFWKYGFTESELCRTEQEKFIELNWYFHIHKYAYADINLFSKDLSLKNSIERLNRIGKTGLAKPELLGEIPYFQELDMHLPDDESLVSFSRNIRYQMLI